MTALLSVLLPILAVVAGAVAYGATMASMSKFETRKPGSGLQALIAALAVVASAYLHWQIGMAFLVLLTITAFGWSILMLALPSRRSNSNQNA